MNLDILKSHYANYRVLRDAQAVQLLKLAIYHKFICDDPHYKEWADAAFNEYLEMLRKVPPDFEIVKELQKAANNYRIV